MLHDSGATQARRRRVARKARGQEPADLPLAGVLAWWDSRWKVGRVLGDDGQEHDIDMGAFGQVGLDKARAGLRIRFRVAPSPDRDARAVAARPETTQ